MLKQIFCLHRKFLLYNLVARNIKLKYRKSVLGILWTAVGPAASAVVYYFVFKFVMRVEVPNYLVCVFAGTLVWSFFANSILQGLESIVGNQVLLSKVPMPLNVFPLAETVTLFINLITAIPILIVVMLITGAPITWNLLWLPMILGIFFIQAYALALLTAVWFVHLRDLRHMFIIILQVLFYANPIVYTLEMLPKGFEFLPYFIPTAFLFESMQNILVLNRNIEMERLGVSVLWTAFFFLLSAWTFFSQRKRIPEII